MKMFSRSANLIVLVTLFGPISVMSRGSDEDARSTTGDMFCGPRAVFLLLEHFHFQAENDLLEIIKDTQWPDWENGTTLITLEKALNKRGLSTLAISLPRGSGVQWPHPILVHLRASAVDGIGHFALCRNDGESQVYLYTGMGDGKWLTRAELDRQRSETVLLVSDTKLTASDVHLIDNRLGFSGVFGVIAGICGAAYFGYQTWSVLNCRRTKRVLSVSES